MITGLYKGKWYEYEIFQSPDGGWHGKITIGGVFYEVRDPNLTEWEAKEHIQGEAKRIIDDTRHA